MDRFHSEYKSNVGTTTAAADSEDKDGNYLAVVARNDSANA